MSLFQVTKKQVIENYELRTMTGDIVSFTPSYSQLLPDPFSDLNVTVNVEATGGNGTPDNPNPIVGYSSANITRCGVNLFDKSTVTSGRLINGAGNEVSYSGWNVSDYIPVPEGASLYLNGLTTHPNTLQDNFELFDASKTKIGYANVRTNEYPWTIPTGTKYVKFSLNDSDSNTAQFSPTNNAPYTPYNGQTYAVSFGQTVYGGVLDATRGKLTVTCKLIDLGDLGWVNENAEQTGLCRANSQFTDCVWHSVMICSAYNYNSATSYNRLSDGDIALTNSESIPLLRIRNTDYSTYTNTQIKEALTGVKLIYQTKTPFDIDLTPEVISAIVGTNNVFADCGQTTVTCLI